jgi:hypothetical protein
VVQALSNDTSSSYRHFHPLRFQRWAFSDLNPLLWWLAPAAQLVKSQRQALAADDPARKMESTISELTSASLDCYRALRDGASEAAFFQIYGNLSAFYLGDEQGAETAALPGDPRQLSFVKKALASIDKGGYAEALARVAFLMAQGRATSTFRVQLGMTSDEYRPWLPAAPDEVAIGAKARCPLCGTSLKGVADFTGVVTDQTIVIVRLCCWTVYCRRARATHPTTAGQKMLARLRGVLGSTVLPKAQWQRSRSAKDSQRQERQRRCVPLPTTIRLYTPPANRSDVCVPRWSAGSEMDVRSESLLSGRKGLVVGIANEQSIAYGCARMFRNCGAELAMTWINEKTRTYVEPLARELSATIMMPLDVEQPGAMEALFDTIRDRWTRLDFVLHPIASALTEICTVALRTRR